MTARFWFCAAAFGSIVLAQSPETFTATGAMAFSRVQHTATLLSSGKVLVTGGIQGSTVLSSAELYDPASGTFGATGSMITTRGGHTATLLADGKVLIAGGFPIVGGFPAARGLSSAELYDPGTGVFTRTGDMAQGRAYHAATLLANGKVLIAGNEQESTHTAELYDPVAGTFTAAGLLPFIASRLTLLPGGKVLVQGYGADGYATGRCWGLRRTQASAPLCSFWRRHASSVPYDANNRWNGVGVSYSDGRGNLNSVSVGPQSFGALYDAENRQYQTTITLNGSSTATIRCLEGQSRR